MGSVTPISPACLAKHSQPGSARFHPPPLRRGCHNLRSPFFNGPTLASDSTRQFVSDAKLALGVRGLALLMYYPFFGEGRYTLSRSQVAGSFLSAVFCEIMRPVLESRKITTGVCFTSLFLSMDRGPRIPAKEMSLGSRPLPQSRRARNEIQVNSCNVQEKI